MDDEIDILKSFEIALSSGGLNNTYCCSDSRAVISILLSLDIEVVLLNLTMPFITGEDLLAMIVQDFPGIPVIVITGNTEIEAAVKCMKAGAFDYIVKPVEKSRLVSGVKRAVELRELEKKNRLLKHSILSGTIKNPEAFSNILTVNRKMQSLFQYAESIAKSPHPVLITGETGVGKELMARAVHTLSGVKGPFVSVNAAGIDDNVFSDTLFGHTKGAFTGAEDRRAGLVEKASGGTLLLDEIGDLSANMQIKLLRLLQEREYYPLGSDLPKRSDTRILVTTNQDLQPLQESGSFRKDLYYRLSTHHLHIIPLRERTDDLPLLLDHFLEAASKTIGKKKPTPPVELITLLSNYSFPGNVRELKAIIFDTVSNHKLRKLSMESIKTHVRGAQKHSQRVSSALRFQTQSLFSGIDPLPTLEEATRMLMTEAMKRSNNNQSMAAELLAISRQRLARHLRSFTR